MAALRILMTGSEGMQEGMGYLFFTGYMPTSYDPIIIEENLKCKYTYRDTPYSIEGTISSSQEEYDVLLETYMNSYDIMILLTSVNFRDQKHNAHFIQKFKRNYGNNSILVGGQVPIIVGICLGGYWGGIFPKEKILPSSEIMHCIRTFIDMDIPCVFYHDLESPKGVEHIFQLAIDEYYYRITNHYPGIFRVMISNIDNFHYKNQLITLFPDFHVERSNLSKPLSNIQNLLPKRFKGTKQDFFDILVTQIHNKNEKERVKVIEKIYALSKRCDVTMKDIPQDIKERDLILPFLQSIYDIKSHIGVQNEVKSNREERIISYFNIFAIIYGNMNNSHRDQWTIQELPTSLKETEVLKYINEVSALLQKLELKLSDIPQSVRSKRQILIYLQIQDLLKVLHLTTDSIPLVFKNDLEDQLKYLQELKEGKQEIKKATIMVVGEEGVGKTTLIKYFLGNQWTGDEFEAYENTTPISSPTVDSSSTSPLSSSSSLSSSSVSSWRQDVKATKSQEALPSAKIEAKKSWRLRKSSPKSKTKSKVIHRSSITDGINVNQWKPEGRNFVLNVYDFAGQEIYYNTHQFFLSNDSVYLLVFNGSKSINQNRVAHWLHTISTIAPSSYLFIVGTFYEKKKSNEIFDENASSLSKIIDHILFLDEDKRIQVITPPTTETQPSSYHNIIWKISLSNPGKASPIPLRNAIFDLMEEKIANRCQTIPAKWLRFRNFLFDANLNAKGGNLEDDQQYYDRKYDIERNPILKEIYTSPAFRLGILQGEQFISLAKIADINEVQQFLQLLNFWGDLIYVNNARKNQSFVVINPTILISIFKFIISAKKILKSKHSKKKVLSSSSMGGTIFTHFNNVSGSHSVSSNTVTNIKDQNLNTNSNTNLSTYANADTTPHLIQFNQFITLIQQKFPEISETDALNITKSIVVPVLTELRLIQHLNNDIYLIPSMLQKSKPTFPKDLLMMYNLHFPTPTFVALERRYEFVYLPSGLFTRLMIEVWQYFLLSPRFATSVTKDENFWENGFILSTGNDAPPSYAVIQLIKSIGIAATLSVEIFCDRNEISSLLPKIHRSIVNIIQSLEFENKTKIYCAVKSAPVGGVPSFHHLIMNSSNEVIFYDHSDCLSTALNNSSSNDDEFPSELLQLLIPEFYSIHSSMTELTEEEEQLRYQTEVIELMELGSGASGVVLKGKWFNQLVAIKKPLRIDSFEISSLLNEIELLRSLNHPNLLRLLDVYIYPLAIISELCQIGDLDHVLRSSQFLHPVVACKILRDLASVLSFLHNRDIPIIHCDVRLPNIFIKDLSLDAEICAILGDVGFSRIADRINKTSGKKSVITDIMGFLGVMGSVIVKLQMQIGIIDVVSLAPITPPMTPPITPPVSPTVTPNVTPSTSPSTSYFWSNSPPSNSPNSSSSGGSSGGGSNTYRSLLNQSFSTLPLSSESFSPSPEYSYLSNLKNTPPLHNNNNISNINNNNNYNNNNSNNSNSGRGWTFAAPRKINPPRFGINKCDDNYGNEKSKTTDDDKSKNNNNKNNNNNNNNSNVFEEMDEVKKYSLEVISFLESLHKRLFDNLERDLTAVKKVIETEIIQPYFQKHTPGDRMDPISNTLKRSLELSDPIISQILKVTDQLYEHKSDHDFILFALQESLSLLGQKLTQTLRSSHSHPTSHPRNSILRNLQSEEIDHHHHNNNHNQHQSKSQQKRSVDMEELSYSLEWREVCRSLYPVLQISIQENIFELHHFKMLMDLNFLDHPQGDNAGMKLYHYACVYSCSWLLSQLLESSPHIDVNEKTRLHNKSSAIHLAVNSSNIRINLRKSPSVNNTPSSATSTSSSNNNNNSNDNVDEQNMKIGKTERKSKNFSYKSNFSGFPAKGIDLSISNINLLFKYGANINLRDRKGETALLKAASAGNFPVVVALLNLRADPNIQSNEGITAIVAASRDYSESFLCCIKALLQFGSFYSSSLFIANSELLLIRKQAEILLADWTSSFARNRYNEHAIRSWIL